MALPAADTAGAVAPPVPVAAAALAPAMAATPSTRYRPPSSQRQPVQRRRLLDRLATGPVRRLVLIHGPAGFGKSTLASEWVNMLAAQGVRVAWLSVDDDDDNVVWFLSHVVAAIRHAHPAITADLERLLEEHASDAARRVMTTLIDEIHRVGEPVALVIDDWHRVTGAATIAAMEYLLDHGCHHLRLIVTSRNRTGLPLGRMRVRDDLDEIDETALRFDDAETAEFLADNSGLKLDAAEVERLRASTEGWAAALQLASMSLRDREDPGAYIDQISGRHYAIGEYLMENVVDTLEPELLEFVMRTSVAERVNGDLAEALTGVSHGQDMLEQVRQRDLFLRSIDDDLRWFRYHTLFAEFLRDRLIRLHPGLLEELHVTAANWFADHDMLTEAVDHLLAAGEPQRAVDLVVESGERLMEQSRMGTLLGLDAKLPGSLALSNPRLQLQLAWANVALQRSPAAATALDRADAALAARRAGGEGAGGNTLAGDGVSQSGVEGGNSGEGDGISRSGPGLDDPDGRELAALELEAKLVRTALGFATDQTMRLAPELVRARDSVRPFMAHGLAVGAMISALYRFDFEEVHSWQRWIEPFRDRVRGPFGAIYCDCIDGSAAYEQLDIARAETRFRTALGGALPTGGQSQATRLASALLGELLYEKGQFIEAEELLASGFGVEGGAVEFLMASYGIGARLAAVRGDFDTVHERLGEGAKLATNLHLPRLAARIVNERIRLGLSITDSDRRDLVYLEPYSAHPDAPSAVAAELAQDSAIRLRLREGTDVEAACERAWRLAEVIANQPRPRALLNAELLYGTCLSASGRVAEATVFLAPTLTRCAEQGLVRLVVDAGRPLHPVIETLYGATPADQHLIRVFFRQVLTEFEGAPPSRSVRPESG
ncbi:AAA family ATPase [Nocardia sp. NPDC004722]